MPTEPTRVDDILRSSAEMWAPRAAVIDRAGYCSYSDLLLAAHGILRLLADSHVLPGSVVGISVTSGRSFLSSLFGILGAQCIAIPIPLNLSAMEQERIIRDSEVSWIIKDNISSDINPFSLVACSKAPNNFVANVFPDAAVMRHTSGTTGDSKGVVLSHRAVLERTEISARLLDLRAGDVVLTPLSLSYHFVASALSCVRAGATIIDCVDASAEELLTLAEKHKATHIYASPEHYDLLNGVARADCLPCVRKAISTSGPLRADIAATFESKFSVRLSQVFGIIEVGLPMWNECSDFEAASLGTCRPPYECVVVDERNQQVGTGDVGELLLRGPGMFSGYVFNSQKTQAHPADSWFATGDLVVKNPDKTITFKGRKKSAITLDHVTIFPEEIESILQRAPEIKAVRVIESSDPELGRCLIAEVVIHPSAANAESRWRELCQKELPAHMVPKKFVIVDGLRLTGSGKVVRQVTV